MIRNHKFLKGLAVFLIFEISASTILPSVSWALTAGPTAPEFSSFEPVDTTDMVDLITGDFVYNIPLLEVPGPSGGYPLSLAYHAGIKMDQEASWVGLGWTLNPGAINRSVNGYVDDFENVLGTNKSFWEGGQSRSLTVGVNIGMAGGSSVSAGLIYASDSYKGAGTGYYYGIGTREGFGPLAMNSQHIQGVSPYGESFSSTGLSVGIGAGTRSGLGLSVNAGVSFDQDGKATTSMGGSVSYSNSPGTTASISTSGKSGPNFSIGGLRRGFNNARSGNISTRGYNYSVEIPTPWNFTVNLGKSHQRYWTNETAMAAINGSLYFPTTLPSSANLNLTAYDVYDLQDPLRPLTESPDEQLAGAFIDYDNYNVLGQGIGGAIRPYHYKSYLLRQNKKKGSVYQTKSYPLGVTTKPSFRFIGDFSNRYEHDMALDAFQSNSSTPLSFTFNADRKTGENGNEHFDVDSNTLPGSRNVQWFTNAQIYDAIRRDEYNQPVPPGPESAINNGFIDCNALGFERSDDKQIGGFKLTNESGVTYHYALPVYSYDEYQYSGTVDQQNKHHYSTFTKPARYAYTWLLTAVTGPDFSDQNHNGYADAGDWGYWVTFEYGKWSGAYSWRNPANGEHSDVDRMFSHFSKGKKEVYYLNAVKTETHTAFFVKEIRADGKGIVHEMDAIVGADGNRSSIDKGSFREINKVSWGTPYTEYPVSTLKLHSVYLLQNKDIVTNASVSSVALSGNTYYHSEDLTSDLGKYTYGKNIIDIHDIENYPDIKSQCLKKIELKTDYSLCSGTPNSYKSALDVYNTTEPVEAAQLGKLTLRSLATYGRGGASLLPEIKFNYTNEVPFVASTVYDRVNNQIYDLSVRDFDRYDFKKGEVIRIQVTGGYTYAYVQDINPDADAIKIDIFSGADKLQNSLRVNGGDNLRFYRTQNPPYHQEAQDLWGLYKSDFFSSARTAADNTENIRRMTTSVSAQARDAWSLKEIVTVLGAKVRIKYESDVYKNALKSLSNIPIKSIEAVAGGKTKITLYEDAMEYGLDQGVSINFALVTALRFDVYDPGRFDELRFDCNGGNTYVYKWYPDYTNANPQYPISIESVDGQSLIVNYNFMNRYPQGNDICLMESKPYSEQNPQLNCVPLDQLIRSEPIFLGGEILSGKIFAPYGGDLRVKKISVDSWNTMRSTSYEYFNGITPYEPLGFKMPISTITQNIYPCLREMEQEVLDDYKQRFFDDVYKRYKILFANSRELPGPGVMYEWVRVIEEVKNSVGSTQLDGKTEYQFEVFSPKTMDISTPGAGSADNPIYDKIASITNYGSTQYQGTPADPILELPVQNVSTSQSSRTQIRDFTSIMGSLKRVILYDKDQNKISETSNQYLHDDFDESDYLAGLNEFKNQGVVAETFADARIILNTKAAPTDPDSYTLYGIISQKVKYPSIQVGQTTINYKSGIRNESRNLAFDYYSGAVTKTQVTDGYGNIIISENMPAYRAYPEMGLGAEGNKNMLSQEASFIVYSQNANNEKGLLSAQAQTWSKSLRTLDQNGLVVSNTEEFKIWKKDAMFSWIGDDKALINGLYPYTDFSAFSFANPETSSQQWELNSSTTLTDIYSHVLEATDLNGNYATTKMSSDQLQVFASAANAGYHDIAYSGAEDTVVAGKFGGNVSIGNGVLTDNASLAHTGSKSLLVDPSDVGFIYDVSKELLKNKHRTYHACVWVKERIAGSIPNVSLIAETNGGSLIASASPRASHKAGVWYQINLDFDLPVSTDQIKVYVKNDDVSGCYIDDFRLHPLNASMNSYVYNKWGELSHALDANNVYIRYEYDAVGRLKETYKESFGHGVLKVGDVQYNYKNSSH